MKKVLELLGKTSPQVQQVKMVILGNGSVGKTTLLIKQFRGTYPHEYVPTVYDSHVARAHINEEPVDYCVCDTGGGEDYHRLRLLSYPQTDVFLLCFSLTDPYSYRNLLTDFYPKVAYWCPHTPILVVGMKQDLCHDTQTIDNLRQSGCAPLTHDDGIQLCQQIGAINYVECSSLADTGVKKVFEQALYAALHCQTCPGFMTEP